MFLMKSKKSLRVIKILAVMILLAAAVRWGLSAGKETAKNTFQILQTVTVAKGDLLVRVESLGEVKPYNRVEMKAPIAGRVEEVLVQEGDLVKKGQTLAWMSSTERAALLDAARSQGDAVFKKWQDTYKLAPLISPLDGTVIVRAVEPGQTVTTIDPILVISDLLIVKASVDETDLAQIQKGQKAEITLDAYRGRKVSGIVKHISYESLLINNVNMYEVDVLPQDAPEFLRSGMTAGISFVVMERSNVLTVPSEAIAQWPRDPKSREPTAGFCVYKKGFGDKPAAVPVEIGVSDGRMTEIVSGLKEGESILVVRKKETQKDTFSPFGGPGGRPAQKRA